jgi:hypothetical protein
MPFCELTCNKDNRDSVRKRKNATERVQFRLNCWVTVHDGDGQTLVLLLLSLVHLKLKPKVRENLGYDCVDVEHGKKAGCED